MIERERSVKYKSAFNAGRIFWTGWCMSVLGIAALAYGANHTIDDYKEIDKATRTITNDPNLSQDDKIQKINNLPEPQETYEVTAIVGLAMVGLGAAVGATGAALKSVEFDHGLKKTKGISIT